VELIVSTATRDLTERRRLLAQVQRLRENDDLRDRLAYAHREIEQTTGCADRADRPGARRGAEVEEADPSTLSGRPP
jgi:hypothetical protein